MTIQHNNFLYLHFCLSFIKTNFPIPPNKEPLFLCTFWLYLHTLTNVFLCTEFSYFSFLYFDIYSVHTLLFPCRYTLAFFLPFFYLICLSLNVYISTLLITSFWNFSYPTLAFLFNSTSVFTFFHCICINAYFPRLKVEAVGFFVIFSLFAFH